MASLITKTFLSSLNKMTKQLNFNRSKITVTSTGRNSRDISQKGSQIIPHYPETPDISFCEAICPILLQRIIYAGHRNQNSHKHWKTLIRAKESCGYVSPQHWARCRRKTSPSIMDYSNSIWRLTSTSVYPSTAPWISGKQGRRRVSLIVNFINDLMYWVRGH